MTVAALFFGLPDGLFSIVILNQISFHPTNSHTSTTVGARGNTSYAPYTEYVLKLTTSAGSLLSTAGRPTGFMLRPVKYVRVE